MEETMQRLQARLIRFVLIPIAALIVAATAWAQFDSGQISGFVRDETGAMVPGAAVTVTNDGNGEQRKTNTNTDGYYVFPQLYVGTYTISVQAAGFKRFVTTGIVVDSLAKVSVDASLAVGAISEQVEVLASATQVKTD